MAVRHPVPGSFGHYATRYLGPYLGFLTGWSYAFSMLMVCLADVTVFGVYMGFWYPDTPRWIWVLGIVLCIGGLNLCSVKVFGELEFWLSLLKVVAILALIAGGAAVLLSGMRIGGADATAPALANLWQHGGFFPNGIEGMIASFTVVMFAFGGVEVIGMAAGEAGDPRRVIQGDQFGAAAHTAVLRADPAGADGDLPWSKIGTQGTFVQIFSSLGIKAAADVLNLVVISAVISAVNSDIFSTGRMLYGMALNGQAPAGFARCRASACPG